MRPFRETPQGLEVFLRVTPRAASNRIAGLQEDSAGGCRLKVHVTTVPEDGKANKAVIKLLAKSWKLAKTQMTVTAGATDRNKTILVTGDVAAVTRLIGADLPK